MTWLSQISCEIFSEGAFLFLNLNTKVFLSNCRRSPRICHSCLSFAQNTTSQRGEIFSEGAFLFNEPEFPRNIYKVVTLKKLESI